jgi:hypothetical protein
MSTDCQHAHGYRASMLGEELRKSRKKAGLTQEELSFRANLDRTYISTVADMGIGIPAEFQPYIFNKFFRVPGQSNVGAINAEKAPPFRLVFLYGRMVTCRTARPKLCSPHFISSRLDNWQFLVLRQRLRWWFCALLVAAVACL